MALHINNPAVELEIRSLAADTGETLTDAIRIAVQERRRRLRPKVVDRAVYEKIMQTANRIAALPDFNQRSEDDILDYDEHGLPG